MGDCRLCGKESNLVSRALGVCLGCIRERPREALEIAARVHAKSRTEFGLPESPPADPDGVACAVCVNRCKIGEGGLGYCGARGNRGGKITGVSSTRGKLSWYHDPLPTNCVGDRICPGGTGAGHPEYAYLPGPEIGYNNLAVFFQACSFNCLFCQNWHFKRETLTPGTASVESLVADIGDDTACVCYFGGDPGPQLPFSIKASEKALSENEGRILRVCWETNGSMSESLLHRMLELARVSGGCVKFDLKAWDENLHIALTGVTNRRTLANFKKAAAEVPKRPVPPLLLANTLLTPGYIDEEEIRRIARFIAGIDPSIPYSLLVFHPQFYMRDLPITSRETAERCIDAAREQGLENVRLGNAHLLNQ